MVIKMMVEITKRNKKGNIEHIAWIDEKEFIKSWKYKVNQFVDNHHTKIEMPLNISTPSSNYFGDYLSEQVYGYVAYSKNGKIIPRHMLASIVRKGRKKWVSNYNSWSKRSFGNYFRSIKTTQERRWNNAWDDVEDAPKARAKRSNRCLPDAYWDIPRQETRSWKAHRKTQWKTK